MSPVTPTPGLKPAADAAPKGSAELSAGHAAKPAAAVLGADAVAAGTAAGGVVTDGAILRNETVPNLNPGKLVPGPDDWRALERRASLFRA